MLMDNTLESKPTFTETNLAIISTTIRYGSFQLQARAVPKTYGIPTRVSSTTSTITTPNSTPPTITTADNSTVATPLLNATSTIPVNPRILTDMFRNDFDNGKSGHNEI